MNSWERDKLAEDAEKQRREDEARRLREQHERNLQRMGPAPPVQANDPRFPGQTIVHLNPPARVNGSIPEVDGRSEAEILNDPKRRLAALEQRVAQLEARLEEADSLYRRGWRRESA